MRNHQICQVDLKKHFFSILFLFNFQKLILHDMYRQTFFPSRRERINLGQKTGLTARQVQIWFQNMRRSDKNCGKLVKKEARSFDVMHGILNSCGINWSLKLSTAFNSGCVLNKRKKQKPLKPLKPPVFPALHFIFRSLLINLFEFIFHQNHASTYMLTS